MFYAGDIMDKKIKKAQIVMDWALFKITLNMQELSKVVLKSQQNYLKEKVKQFLQNSTTKSSKDGVTR